MCIPWQPEYLIYKYMYNQSVIGMFATEMILNISLLKSSAKSQTKSRAVHYVDRRVIVKLLTVETLYSSNML